MTTRHVIRKDGRLYRLAYLWHANDEKPKTVNLCNLIWLAAWSLLKFILSVIFIIVVGCIVLLFIVGVVQVLWDAGKDLVGWLINPHLPTLSKDQQFFFFLFGSCFGLAIVLFALLFGIRKAKKSETAQLLAAYIRAKKQKICPIYKVI
jgi:uncharacterized membrane protein